MRRRLIPSPFIAAFAAFAAACDAGEPAARLCTDARVSAALPRAIDEASGIAWSTGRDVLWIHNDSELRPTLYAIDPAGALVAEIGVNDAVAQRDWEDIAVGPCPAGRCIYIGAIGDNNHNREDRAILRITEPRVAGEPGRLIISTTEAAGFERFPFRYPDGPRDAEAMFVMPDTTVWIITKGRDGPVGVYRYPQPLRADERVELEFVQHLSAGIVQLPDMVTGADAAVDGSRIALRTYGAVRMYRIDGDTLAPLWPAPGFPVTALREPQGEGIALAGDTVHLVSEDGPFGTRGRMSRLVCPG